MKTTKLLKQVVLILFLLFTSSYILLSTDVKYGSKVAPESKELIDNGSFEDADEHRNGRDLIRKKFDIETNGDAWAAFWKVNSGVGSGKVRIVTAEDAPDGKRYLRINSTHDIHISGKNSSDATKTYTYSFKAKGPGRMRLCVYLYGVKAGKKGDRQYMGYPTIKGILLTKQWKTFSGTLKIDNPNARHFILLLACRGDVSVDQVSLKIKQSAK